LSGKSIATWRTERWAGVRTLSPDGQLLASLERGSRINECVVIRRVATGEKVCELPLDGANHRSPIAFSHNGKTVAVSGLGYRYHESDAVRLFDTATGKELRTIRGHTGRITALAFSPDGTRLATGSTDTTVLIWDLTAKP